jgi:hypothetical protein
MTALPFKPGERIAIPALPVLRVENDVAILKKIRVTAQGGCGARHQIRIETPFFIRGGFRVQKTSKYKVPGWAFTVRFETPWGTVRTENVPQRTTYLERIPDSDVALAEMLARQEYGNTIKKIVEIKINEPVKMVDVYVRRFKHGTTIEIPEGDYFKYVHGPYYFVYEFVSSDEAKLVDDTSRVDYVLLIFDNSQESRAGCARVKLASNDGVVWHETRNTCCAIASYAAAMAIARYGSRVAVARNKLPYRGCCEEWEIEEWESVFPPRRVAQYTSTEPITTDLKPEEVV